MNQLGLYDVLSAYGEDPMSNEALYRSLKNAFSLSESDFDESGVVATTGSRYSVLKRTIRWHQQTLKHSGLLTRVGNRQWQRTGASRQFTQLIGEQALLSYSTEMGCALWGDIHSTAAVINEPIQLYFSSPPYPLACPRSYGNVHVNEYVDWLCDAVKPVISKLADGGAIALNLSNDIFCSGRPNRSSYLSRLTVAFEDNLDLFLMDTIAWISNKAPGPIRWAQKSRVQLHTRWEPILWFTNNPEKVLSDNGRIQSEGISGNVWNISNYCAENRKLLSDCARLGLPAHDAMFPLELARRAVEFWTEPGQLVVDLMSGSNTLGFAAESLGRKWVSGERNAQFALSGALRWSDLSKLDINPELIRACS